MAHDRYRVEEGKDTRVNTDPRGSAARQRDPWYVKNAAVLIGFGMNVLVGGIAWGDLSSWRQQMTLRMATAESDISGMRSRDTDLRVSIATDIATIKTSLLALNSRFDVLSQKK